MMITIQLYILYDFYFRIKLNRPLLSPYHLKWDLKKPNKFCQTKQTLTKTIIKRSILLTSITFDVKNL